MLSLIRKFMESKKGNLIENMIYIIIIGTLCYTFYSEKVTSPLNSNIEDLNTQITKWTTAQTNK